VGYPCAWLYLPASRAVELLDKACDRADGVILDLEDATHPSERVHAREVICESLTTNRAVPIDIRINSVESPDFDADVALLADLMDRGVNFGVRLPKVSEAADVVLLAERLCGQSALPAISCLIESALGVSNLEAIASQPGVRGISLGESDLRADLRLPIDGSGELSLMYVRQRLVVASVAAGLGSPIASVYPNIRDLEGFRSSCEAMRAIGFWGRNCIHPSQVEVVRSVFQPRPEELAWAREVLDREKELASQNSAAGALTDGSFIDPAIYRQASEIVARTATK